MKKLSIASQRKLYQMYREARLKEASNLIQSYSGTTFSKYSDSDIYESAKQDILKFTSVFEELLINEVKADLEKVFK